MVVEYCRLDLVFNVLFKAVINEDEMIEFVDFNGLTMLYQPLICCFEHPFCISFKKFERIPQYFNF